jgi:RNA polymerase sigma-70 factor (ECF subfamily)
LVPRTPDPTHLADDLLAHAAFLRRIAAALLGDEAAADDVAQESLLALHAAREPRDPRAWTARVARFLALKRRRGDARRTERERAIARPEAQPDARARSLAAVTAAVLALDAVHRDAVLARFYEGLTPAAIAERDGVPLATVKSRLARALTRLRAVLDAEHGGDRRAWSLGLAALAGRDLAPAGGAGAAASGGVLGGVVMASHGKLVPVTVAAAVVALALAGGRAWLAGPRAGAEPEAPVAEPALAGAPALDEPDGDLERPAVELAGAARPFAREGAGVAAEASTAGDLVAEVAWHDGTPAEGVFVKVLPAGSELAELATRRRATDADGRATFAGLPPGSAAVSVDRGGSARAAVAAGAIGQDAARVRFDLARGMDVVVRVVDARGERVSGAEVWLSERSSFTRGNPVGTTDGRGELALRALHDQLAVGARKAGYGPAWTRWLAGNEGDAYELELVLAPAGAALDVQVLGSDGAPLSAVVQARGERGDPDVRPGNEREQDPMSVLAVTGPDGRCAFPTLAGGRVEVLAAAAGHAPLARVLELVEGERAEVVLRLDRGFRVAGTARTEDGTPLAGVSLRAGGYDLLGARATSDADGRYAFPHLPVGRADLRADLRDVGRDEVALVGALGDVLVWDPVLDPGAVLALRLVDDAGAALPRWYVEVHDAENEYRGGYRSAGWTDAGGRYRARNASDVELVVTASSSTAVLVPEARFPGLFAGASERELVVPRARVASARIGGRVVDGAGRPSTAMVCVAPQDGSSAARCLPASPADGRFAFGPLPPGGYALLFGPAGSPLATREVTLASGEARELGDVELAEPARLVLASEVPEGLAADDVHVLVFAAGTRSIRAQGSLAALAAGVDLAEGSYTIDLGGAAVPERHAVVLRAGETTRLQLAPRRAVEVLLRFELAPDLAPPQRLEVTLTGAGGSETRTVMPRAADGAPGQLVAALRVAPDEPLHARFAGDGVHGEAWITGAGSVEVLLGR